ncbi:MAG: InlB B-repeat-containing protein [Paludibacteraceae bacterium]|nr:InlB B-repeat-containing protein [Paludibacteraceae bacterium]MBQ9297127.1 InlB B-repeat-containing protein [Paludibacteraceae bacterium]MBR1556470.1 InlB B-repeat-containing protein [Prevotella sp.]
MKNFLQVNRALAAKKNSRLVNRALAAKKNSRLVDRALAAKKNSRLVNRALAAEKNSRLVNRALAAEKNFRQVIRALAAEKNVFTLNSLSNPDGQPTVKRQSAVALQSGKRSEKAPLSPSCLKCASYLPPTCPRPDSLSLVSRQSDLDQVRAVSVGLSTRVWKHVAVIFAVLVMSMANIGMAWGATYTWTFDNSSNNSDVDLQSKTTELSAYTSSGKSMSYVGGSSCKIAKKTAYLAMGGASTQSSNALSTRYFILTAPSANGTISVTFAGTASGNELIRTDNGDYQVIATATSTTKVSSLLSGLTAGTTKIYIAFTNKCYISSIAWTDADAPEALTSLYSSDYKSSMESGASISVSSSGMVEQTGGSGWVSAYSKYYKATSTNKEATITFSPALSLVSDGNDRGKIRIYYGSTDKYLNATVISDFKINGGSSIGTAYGVLEKEKVHVIEYTIPVGTSTLTTIYNKVAVSNGCLLHVEVLTHSATPSETWVVAGQWDSYSTSSNTLTGSGTLSTTISLAANKRYEFKIVETTGNNWYGNSGAIIGDMTNWTMATDKNNCRLHTGPAGDYTFTFDPSTKNLSVTYPSVTHPSDYYVYFKNSDVWGTVYGFMTGGSGDFAGWPGTVTNTTTICGETYHYGALLNNDGTYNKIIFNNGGSEYGNQTSDLTMPGAGKYNANRDANWHDFTTYTISFNAGGGTGTMSAIEGLCPNSNQALPANTFEKTDNIFSGWHANVATKVGGSTVAIGGDIADEATLQEINSNIILTAQWTACSGPNASSSTWTAGGYTYDQNAPANEMSLTGVTASNGGALSYQWYKTTSDVAHGEAISGATSNTYTPATDVAHTTIWYYFCRVTEAGCSTTYTSGLSGAIVVNEAVDPCSEPAKLTNEIARFFVPCGTGQIKYEVTNANASTNDNTFTTVKLGSTDAEGWYVNPTSGLRYAKLTSNDSYIQIKLKSGNFQAGDVVTAYFNRDNATKTGLTLKTQGSSYAITPANTAAGVETSGSYTLVADAIESDGSIKLFRANSSSFVNRIIVTRAPVAASVTATLLTPEYMPTGASGVQISLEITGASTGWYYRVKNTGTNGYQTPDNVTYTTTTWTMTSTIGTGANTYVVELYDGTNTNQATSSTITVTGETTHPVTITAGAGGTVSPSGVVQANGNHIKPEITATPSSGYRFVNWTLSNSNAILADATSATTTITNATGACTITANFEETVGCIDANSTNFGAGNGSGDASKTLADGTVVAMNKCTNSASSVSIGGNILFTAPSGKAFETFSFVATCGSENKTNYYKINGGSQQSLEKSTTTSKTYTITISDEVDATTIQIIKNGTTPAVSSFCYTLKNLCTPPAAPEELGVDSKDETSATLSWDGGSAGANGYVIKLVANDGGAGAFDWTECAPATYTATGLTAGKNYTFSVKYKGTGAQCEFSEEVTTSFTTTAATTYSITYNCDGAESGCPANVAAATNLPNPLPSAPTKSGYTFGGWYTDSEKTVAAVAGAALTANTTLYAKWTEDECTPTTLFSMVMKSDAADYTLAANEDMTTELTDRIQTLTGGDVMMHNNSSSTRKAIESKCVKLVENDVYLKVELSGSNTLQEGDVITITTKTAYQPYITKTATRATTPTMTKTGSSDPYTYSITLANTNAAFGKDIIGGGTLYFWKASSAVFIRSITITRPCDESAETCKTPNITNIAGTTNMTTAETKSLNVTVSNTTALTGTVSYAWTNSDGTPIAAAAKATGTTTARLTLAEPEAGTYTFMCTVTNDCGGGDSQSATSAVFTVVVTASTGCTEIAKVIVSGTSTGTGSGTKIAETGGYGVKLESTTASYGDYTGYKLGSSNYVYLQLASGEQFQNGDKVKVYITKISDLGSAGSTNRQLHIFQGTTGAGTEVATVESPALGWNEATLSGVTSGQRSLTIHRSSGTTEQNHYIYAFAVERCVDCTPATHEGLAYTKTSYTVGETATALTVTNPENVDTYQWKYNTTNDRTGGTTCGTNAASFTPPTTAEVAGTRYYWCELTNDCGTVKTSAVGITVSANLDDVTVTWTDPTGTVNYGGGGYTITAQVTPAAWDGTLDASMLTAPEGIRIYDVEINNTEHTLQATFDVQTTFDREANATAIPFALTLAATANYDGITSNHNVTYDACAAGGGGGNVYVIGYSNNTATNVSSSSAFRAYETASDWYTEGNTTFTDKTTTDGFTIKGSQKSGYYWRNDGTFSTSGGDKSRLMTFKLTKSDKITITWTGETVSFSKVRIIGRNTSDDATTYTVSNGTTEKTFTYEAGLGGKVQIKEVEMEFVSGSTKGITISGGTKECNVLIELTPASSGGTETTALTWSNGKADGATLAKDEGTADFAVTAVRDAAATTSLGALTYTSSDASVATVNETTGQVHIADNIDFGGATYKETTITATLAASGCYKRAQITYILRVNARPCDDVAGTVTSTSDGCTTTLTLSGYTAGATIQWYKDGVSLGSAAGAQTATYAATASGEYYAVTSKNCDRTSNTVTVTSTAVSATKIVDEWYVKNGRRTPDIALVQTTNATDFTVTTGSPASDIKSTGIGGCGFYLGTDGIIYLKGAKNDGTAPSDMTEGDDVLSITATGCSDAAPVSVTIHRQEETDKYVLAYVVTGKQDGGWTQDLPPEQTTGVELYRTLNNHFDLQATNIYATTDEQKIKEYYSRYDIIFITDYPNTKLTNKTTKKSYVNALGAMIDIRPILTMEAWVSGLSNWSAKGVAGNPKSPTTRQYNMLLQCKDHEIFSGTTVETIGEGDEMMFKINMVDSTKALYDTLDTNYGAGTHKEKEGYCYGTHPALQGFVYDEALADMLPLGLIDDGAGNDLQVGLERQKEMEARMMVLGINADAMERLSDDGETVIVNALKYLMKKDAEDISDCSIYFDNAYGDGQWNNVANWGPSHLTLPLPSQEARIMAPCTVNGSVAKAASVKIVTDGTYNHGTATANGSLTIAPTGILSVGGRIVSASAPNYYETRPTDAGKLVIQADNTHTGALIHGHKSGTLNATVQLVSKAYSERVTEGGKTKTKKYWQYVGLPVQEALAEEAFYGGYTYKYEESAGWEKKRTGDMLEEFWGIGLSYDNYVLGKTSPITFTISGALALATNRDIELTKTAEAGNGENMIGNSWTAPIHLVNMTADDFENATATIYLFNTGRNESHDNYDKGSTTAGQWVSVPVAASKLEPWEGPKVIPAMQAFEVDVAGGASSGTLHLDYDKHVRAIATQTEENAPLRAPKRYMDDEPMMMRLRVADSATYTDLYLIEGEQLSDEFDNGWDGKYQQCDGRSATLYALSPIGNMAVLAQQSVDNTVVVFRPGKYTDYTFTFGNSGEESYYLNDVQLETSTEIKEGNEYRFTYNEGDMEGRFVVSKTPYGSPGTATGIGHTAHPEKVQKIMYNDHIYIIRAGRIYDIVGKQVR